MRLHIENFKCFENINININDLTVFVGANGVGKSTSIQALLLLRETVENLHLKSIPLNDVYGLLLGTSASVIHQGAESNMIRLVFTDIANKELSAEYESDIYQEQLSMKVVNYHKGETFLEKRPFYYISAERLGPRFSQRMKHLEFDTVGIQGENTAQILVKRLKIRKELMSANTENPNLLRQVNFWLKTILPDVEVEADSDNKYMTAQIRVRNTFTAESSVLATNIGFGISYVLPIIVQALVAEEGSMMIVENPEAHLHPAAQSSMGEFLAMIADNNVHVVVETHSDHIISGFQLYIAKYPHFSDKVTINSISIDNTIGQPIVDEVSIDEKGDITAWPKGFLDQAQIDFVKLNELQRNV
ncbi:MAG: DUF3696 domain-containing protein [Bacteroidales bacterium]|nr:DUF3696 domain-containing protein [Bacteroidales bacterium]